MKAISLFSGVGGFELGFDRAGIDTVLQVEIDETCRSVLERHWPETERIADVRDVGANLAGTQGRLESGDAARVGLRDSWRGPVWRRETVDLVYGGFPCQDLSVAGKRAGLGGERSGLWFEFERVLSELRPRWVVIENVPGLLHSPPDAPGRDFAIILNALAELGFDGVAWAVLDAQHFGVPQRRRRVFVVAGSGAASVQAVLSLCESCGGNPETGREAGEGVAGTLRGGSRGSDDPDRATFVAFSGGNSAGSYGLGLSEDITPPLRSGASGTNQVPTIMSTLTGGGDTEASHGKRSGEERYLVMGTLDTHLGDRQWLEGQSVGNYGKMAAASGLVRRLTPLECERLQGWPDDFSRWRADGTEISDSQRYRMIGNGVAAPVAEWIGHRLVAVDSTGGKRG